MKDYVRTPTYYLAQALHTCAVRTAFYDRIDADRNYAAIFSIEDKEGCQWYWGRALKTGQEEVVQFIKEECPGCRLVWRD